MGYENKDMPIDAYPPYTNDLKSQKEPGGDYVTREELATILSDYISDSELSESLSSYVSKDSINDILLNYVKSSENIKYCIINFEYKNFTAGEIKSRTIYQSGEVLPNRQEGTYIFTEYNEEIERKIIAKIPIIYSPPRHYTNQEYEFYNASDFRFRGFDVTGTDIKAKIQNFSDHIYNYPDNSPVQFPAILLLIKGD